jgi:hypothetical protein
MPPRLTCRRLPQTFEWCELYFVKCGHWYCFRYRRSDQRELLTALSQAAADPRLNLDAEDVRKLIAALNLAAICNQRT